MNRADQDKPLDPMKMLEKMAEALRAYRFCEQTKAGANPHVPNTNMHRAFELGRYAMLDYEAFLATYVPPAEWGNDRHKVTCFCHQKNLDLRLSDRADGCDCVPGDVYQDLARELSDITCAARKE